MNFGLVLDWIYPQRCGLCSQLGEAVCQDCRSTMVLRPDNVQPPDGALDYWTAVYAYEGRSAQAVRRLKYGRVTSLATPMAADIRAKFDRMGLQPDEIIPVPIHWTRRFWRGFNQAEYLAESLPFARESLVRMRRTKAQVGLNPQRRATNLEGAFRASTELTGKHFLLIDDVLTTGHTVKECAAALKRRGAERVGALVYCSGSQEPEEEPLEWLDNL